MPNRTAHVAVFDTFNDSEVGLLLVELRTGRFTSEPFNIVTVAESSEPILTMGGFRIVPDALLGGLEPADSDLLVLAGGDLWDSGGGEAFAALAARFLDAGVPVAAICGATAGLARAGLLNEREHTSAAPEYLAATGYDGGRLYRAASEPSSPETSSPRGRSHLCNSHARPSNVWAWPPSGSSPRTRLCFTGLSRRRFLFSCGPTATHDCRSD